MHSLGDAITAQAEGRFSAPDDGPAQSAPSPRDDASASSGANFASARLSAFRYLAVVFLLAAAYFGTARISLLLAIPPGYATAIWPPAGVAVAALMLLGVRYWPGVWLGAMLANWVVPDTSLLVAALISVGNTAEAVFVALPASRLVIAGRLMHQPENVWRFVALALAASAAAATLGVGTLFAAGRVPADALQVQWLTWWLGDTVGIFMLTPLLLSWVGDAPPPVSRATRAEYFAFIAILVAMLWIIHRPWYAAVTPRTPLFAMFPIIAWAAVRLDKRMVMATGFLTAVYTIFVLSTGDPSASPVERNGVLLFTQLYLCTLLLSGLLLCALVYQLSAANAALKAAATGLEQRVKDRTNELNQRAVELSTLTARLIDVQDHERQRLAAELHDVVGQPLGALTAELALLRSGLHGSVDANVLAQIDQSNILVKRAMRAMREVMTELHPSGAEMTGLPAALRWHGEAIRSRTGATVTVRADATLLPPNSKVADALLRICLEALNNAAKHAGAGMIRVTLEARDDRIVLTVCDDGCGFDPSRTGMRGLQSGWGLMIMRERAQSIGAVLRAHSAPGEGTSIEIAVPERQWS